MAAVRRTWDLGRYSAVKIIVCKVASILAGTKTAQIAIQLPRENSQIISSINEIFWYFARLTYRASHQAPFVAFGLVCFVGDRVAILSNGIIPSARMPEIPEARYLPYAKVISVLASIALENIVAKKQLLGRLLAGGLLSVAFALPCPLASAEEEERSLWLFETTCVSNGPGRWRRETEDISVSRAVYRSYMFMGPGSRSVSLACRIRGENSENPENTEDSKDAKKPFQSLQLEFGMRDTQRESPYNTVIVYLDGQQSASETVAAGEKVYFALDVSEVQNIALETVCSSGAGYCDRVYFFNASLSTEPAISPATSPEELLEEFPEDLPEELLEELPEALEIYPETTPDEPLEESPDESDLLPELP